MSNCINKNKNEISKMFDSISKTYDFLNCLLSFGIDKYWRNKLIKEINDLNFKFDKTLDLATGTGDLLILLANKTNVNDIFGADISQNMLEIAKKKIGKKNLSDKIKLIKCEAENLPFDNDYFDLITIAYGIRNFEDYDKALLECFRVLKKNGVIAILEFGIPENRFIRFGYNLYFKKILPFLGFVFSRNKYAYRYLPLSVINFPYRESFIRILEKNGFKNCYFKNLSAGISLLYIGFKE